MKKIRKIRILDLCLSVAYSLSNICTKNYWNGTTIVEIVVGGWVASFFETQCIAPTRHFYIASGLRHPPRCTSNVYGIYAIV